MAERLSRAKKSDLLPDETAELIHYQKLEHLMRLATAGARAHLLQRA